VYKRAVWLTAAVVATRCGHTGLGFAKGYSCVFVPFWLRWRIMCWDGIRSSSLVCTGRGVLPSAFRFFLISADAVLPDGMAVCEVVDLRYNDWAGFARDLAWTSHQRSCFLFITQTDVRCITSVHITVVHFYK
jgi:hypothetical protein